MIITFINDRKGIQHAGAVLVLVLCCAGLYSCWESIQMCERRFYSQTVNQQSSSIMLQKNMQTSIRAHQSWSKTEHKSITSQQGNANQ
jgi:hypothetical protein